MSQNDRKLSVYLCMLLRHDPGAAGLDMDVHGWVSVDQLIRGVNENSRFRLDRSLLEAIVADDSKGRYRFSEDGSRIKCCQGHSVEWVIPELTYKAPPEMLYHGTTTEAREKILASGEISRMKRHAVHMQADFAKAWQSAARWHGKTPVVLVIDAAAMAADGFTFGVSENGVWCTERVPRNYIRECLYEPGDR